MKRHHVYCTCCVHGKELEKSLEHPEKMRYWTPSSCRECYPYDMEDSRSIDLRVNYKESLSGWWWLTKIEITWKLKIALSVLKTRIRKIKEKYIWRIKEL